MRKLLICLLLTLPIATTGCISSMVTDAIETADMEMQKRWNEEWAPKILDKMQIEMLSMKGALIEKLDKNTQEKLDRLDIDPNKHDTDGDGKLNTTEALKLLADMKVKNDNSKEPMSMFELIMAFAGVYGGGSMLKGGVRMAKDKKALEEKVAA